MGSARACRECPVSLLILSTTDPAGLGQTLCSGFIQLNTVSLYFLLSRTIRHFFSYSLLHS